MNSTEIRATITANATAKMGAALEAAGIAPVVWFDTNSFAFQETLPDGTVRWVKYIGTVANDKATSRAPAFDPYEKCEENAQARAEAAAKAAQKKIESDAKKVRDEGKRAKAKAKKDEDVPVSSIGGEMVRRMMQQAR